MSKLPRILILFGLTGLFAAIQVERLGLSNPLPVLGNPSSAISSADDLKQYTAGGHVLGFRKGEMFVASGDHVLRVEFVNARPVSPQDEAKLGDPESSRSSAQPLGKVSYSNLWDGVTLVYENQGGGVVKSTYRIEPVGNSISSPLNQIRLRYNAPVKVDDSGCLVFSYPKGEMRESRPVAWQEIEGKRVPVEATYRLIGEQEVGFKAESNDPRYPLVIDPVLSWNTFSGGSNYDCAYDIAVDSSGNIYVTGYSGATWGSPVRPYTGSYDAFVAKLNGRGALQWNTFLGGAGQDRSYGIAVDASGNVYLAGGSDATWGSPVRPSGGGGDAFAAKLNNIGTLQWNTFLGGSNYDCAYDIAVDTSGNVYVTGGSQSTWGSPVRPFGGGGSDAFAAKLNGSGALQWNTFLGGPSNDHGSGIAVDTNGNVYVTGRSGATWGSPVRSYTGSDDAFVAKLNGSGALQWNTFLGSSDADDSCGLAVDTSENVYVTGYSYVTWGSPVRPLTGFGEAFVAKLNGNGALLWNTFLGSGGDDGYGIAVDAGGNVYVTGISYLTWGSPARPFTGSGYPDAFAAKLNSNGDLQWNTFLGGSNEDWGYAIAVDTSGNVYVAGSSGATWGSPIQSFAGVGDAFVAKISPYSPRVVDFNGDGKEDIFWRHYGTGQNAVWYLGGYTASMPRVSADPSQLISQSIAANLAELEMNQTYALSKVYRDVSEVGGVLPGPPAEVMVFPPPSYPGSGDIRQGVNLSPANAGQVLFWPEIGPRIQTVSILSYGSLPTVTDANWKIAGTGDFNGDGKIDVLWRNSSTGQVSIWLMNGTNPTGYASLLTVTDQTWQIVATGDFNGDGQTDIVWRNSSNGQNSVWFMNGTTVTGYGSLPTVTDVTWQIVGTGDFNSDGQTDIVWRNSSTGQASIWLMNGLAATGYANLPTVTDVNWKIVGTGDFNGDGKPDIIWRNDSTGVNSIWYMNGATNLGYDSLPTVTDILWKIVNR